MFSFYIRRLTVGAAAVLACTPVLAENITPDLQFNGYATAGAAWTSGAHGASYLSNSISNTPGITSSPTMDHDTVAGLQFNYRVNDRTNLVTQLFANEANGDFAVKANWAYIAYKLDDDFTVRAGRLAFSTYLYSENLYVGEAYPWARLPTEIYSTLGGLYSLNGVDLLFRKPLGDWSLTVQPVLGNSSLPGYQINKMRGLAVNLGNDSLTLHAATMLTSVNLNLTSISVGQNTEAGFDAALTAAGAPAATIAATNAALTAGLDQQNVRASYSDFGATYDDGHWFGAAEYAQLRFQGWPQDFSAGYVSAGHYFGDWLPYAIYSRYKPVNNDEATSGFDPSIAPFALQIAQANRQAQHTVAVGVRYQLRANVSVKAQVDRVSGFDNTNGFFAAPSAPLGSPYVYSLSLNTAF